MKIKPKAILALVAVLAAAGIAAAALAGYWNTGGSGGGGNGNGYGDGSGNNGIRGSSTFAEISEETGIPAEDLLQAFAVGSEDPDRLTCSDLADVYPGLSVSTGSVRLFAALYLGEDWDLTGDAMIPEPGVQMLLDRGMLTEEQINYLENHTLPLP